MKSYKASSVISDTIGPMFGIVLPASFSTKVMLKNTFKSLASTTTGTALESKKKKRIRQVFEQFDTDGNGHIDLSEFSNLCKRLGEDMTEEQIKQTLDQIDTDRNGTLEFEEFCIHHTHITILFKAGSAVVAPLTVSLSLQITGGPLILPT